MRTIALVLLVFTPTFGQTVSELNTRYTKSDTGYVVSQNIQMAADYDADGRVCQMRFSPRRLDRRTPETNSHLPFPELKQVLNEMVPPRWRGFKNYGFGMTSFGGGRAWTTYGYDGVTFTFSFLYEPDVDTLKNAEFRVLRGADDSAQASENKAPSSDDFDGSENLKIEIVMINWDLRPCAARLLTTESDLTAQVIRPIVIKNETIDQVFSRLTSDYGIPIGIELAAQELAPARTFDLNLPETNLKEFLDSVLAKDGRYTWKLERNIIHVWPLTGRDSLLTTLLDTKVAHFAFIGNVTMYHVQNEIMNLPEIRSQLVAAGVDPMMFIRFGNMKRFEKETFFQESNLTLREMLDKIVLTTDANRWVVTRWGEKNEFISLRL